jgi:hypothetical protein
MACAAAAAGCQSAPPPAGFPEPQPQVAAGSAPVQPKPKPLTFPATAPAPPTSLATQPATKPEPDADFLALRQARQQSSDKPQQIVLACDQYLAQHPASESASEAQAFADEALDTLWWAKIDQLCQRREKRAQALADNAARIASQTRDGQTPPVLLERKTQLENELADTLEQLRNMRYWATQRPPLSQPAAMALWRSARDPQVYDWWKKVERQKIKDSSATSW